MKKVYSSNDRLMVGHIQNLLEIQDIRCTIRNIHASSNPGFMPINEILPEIWIEDDYCYEKARIIIEEALYSKKIPIGTSWECTNCKETIEPQFSECWNCGESKPDNKNT